MDGRLVMEDGGTVFDLLSLFGVNRVGPRRASGAEAAAQGLAGTPAQPPEHMPSASPPAMSATTTTFRPKFYQLWLDETMTYSCAYYTAPDVGLHQAQIDKLRHIAAKLKLEPGMHIAEIGSGWGALATFLARNYDVRVTSVTLSPEQIAVARDRAEREGVADRVTFLEQDYRELKGTYDRVVSIAMMEAIGIAYFDTYFETIKRLTKPGGFALVHCIGRMSPPGTTAPFIRKYIFPGGYVPALSEVFASLERTGTWCADCENLRLHYYWTIRDWRLAYEAKREEAVAMMGDRFCRMWDFYLAAVELGFLNGSNFVFQMLLANERDAVPVIRDYIVDEERRLAASGAA